MRDHWPGKEEGGDSEGGDFINQVAVEAKHDETSGDADDAVFLVFPTFADSEDCTRLKFWDLLSSLTREPHKGIPRDAEAGKGRCTPLPKGTAGRQQAEHFQASCPGRAGCSSGFWLPQQVP